MSVQRQAIPCPGCGKENDGFTDPQDPENAPTDGDISICLYCATWCVFIVDEDILSQRKCTDEEVKLIRAERRNVEYEAKVKFLSGLGIVSD